MTTPTTTASASLEELARRAAEQAEEAAYAACRAWGMLSDEAAEAARVAPVQSDEFRRSERLTYIAIRADMLRDAAFVLSDVITMMDQQAKADIAK